MPSEPARKRRTAFYRTFALAMELPFIPVIAVVIGGGLGFLLDKRFETGPLFVLVFGALGFVAGIREVVRRLRRNDDDR